MIYFRHTIRIILLSILINNYYATLNPTVSTTTISFYQRIANDILKLLEDMKRQDDQLKIDREKFDEEKQQSQKKVYSTDVLRLNIGGEIMITTRQTLTRIPNSLFSILFNGRWEHKLQIDDYGNIFFDFNPILFRYLLDQLQLFEPNSLNRLSLPSDPSLIVPFRKMLGKLLLNQFLSSEKNVFVINVGGEKITNQMTTFHTIVSSSNRTHLNNNNKSDLFIDYQPKLFRRLTNQLRQKKTDDLCMNKKLSLKSRVSFQNMLSDLGICRKISFDINENTKLNPHGATIAGGNGKGDELNQLSTPCGLYIADKDNHRIVKWSSGAENGEVVAGGNGKGDETNQLDSPTDIILDKNNNSLIICDRGNERIVRWSFENAADGEIMIPNIACYGLAIDREGNLYISDTVNQRIVRWQAEEMQTTTVAGGNGKGDQLNQLDGPQFFFIDENYSLYIADVRNYRIVKWTKDEDEGVILAEAKDRSISFDSEEDESVLYASVEDEDKNSTQLRLPRGGIIDQWNNIYVSDFIGSRIIRWLAESKEDDVIIGENRSEEESNELTAPLDLSFDQQGNLYVVDSGNHRVQKFHIDLH